MSGKLWGRLNFINKDVEKSPLHSCRTKNPSQIRHEDRLRQKRINESESEVVETVEVEDTVDTKHSVLENNDKSSTP